MELRALRSTQFAAAAVFIGATFVLAVQLITPSPVVVSLGENGAETTRIGRYFTHLDVAVVAVSAASLGASGTYLVGVEGTARSIATAERVRDRSTPDGDRPSTPSDGLVTDADDHAEQRRAEWEDTASRLKDHEETVYTLVVDEGGEVPQREIVEETALSKATVSRTLDTLETRGLVERKRRGMGNVVTLQ